MAGQDTYRELTSVFRDVFDDETITLGPQTTSNDIAGWDSQAHVTLIVATEMKFGIRFLTGELESLRNVADLVRLIEAKRAGP